MTRWTILNTTAWANGESCPSSIESPLENPVWHDGKPRAYTETPGKGHSRGVLTSVEASSIEASQGEKQNVNPPSGSERLRRLRDRDFCRRLIVACHC